MFRLIIAAFLMFSLTASEHVRVPECDYTCPAGEDIYTAQLQDCCNRWSNENSGDSSMCYSGLAHCWVNKNPQ